MINFIGFSMVFAFVAIFGLISLAIWIWAIVDCIRSEKSTMSKIVWVLVILLFNLIGAILYFLLRDHDIVPQEKAKKLMRSKDDRVLAGVCGGIGKYFDIDPTIIRLLWVLLTIFSVGTGIILYLVAALIMPEEGKPANKKDKKGVSQKNAGNGIGKVLIISIAAVLIVFILSTLLITLVGLTQYNDLREGVSVSRHITSGISPKERAEVIVIDHIRSHPDYERYAGHSLSCGNVQESEDLVCRNRDPYGVTIHAQGCYMVRCKFDSRNPEIEGFMVEAIVEGNSIRKLVFEKVGRLGQVPEEILTEQDCRDAGYEVLYPELVGGPVQCQTDDGLVNISTEERPDDTLCTNMCGDGICQDIVCMGEGCPCQEDANSCPEDCMD